MAYSSQPSVLYLIAVYLLSGYGIGYADAPAPLNYTIRYFNNAKHEQHNCTYLFAHGLASNQIQGIKNYNHVKGYNGSGAIDFHNHWLIDGPLALFDFQDAKAEKNDFHRKHVCLGQEADIVRLDEAYQKTIAMIPKDHKVVIIGVSRGAATILNWLAVKQPQQVGACVIESAFDDFDNVVTHIMKRFKVGWMPLGKHVGGSLMNVYFPSINTTGIVPIKVVEKINPNIPILFVHGKLDQVVPLKSSHNLCKKMVQAGHQHVYLLELELGEHARLMRGKHAYIYQNVVHAFFKAHELPYDETSATNGFAIFNACRPSMLELQQRIAQST